MAYVIIALKTKTSTTDDRIPGLPMKFSAPIASTASPRPPRVFYPTPADATAVPTVQQIVRLQYRWALWSFPCAAVAQCGAQAAKILLADDISTLHPCCNGHKFPFLGKLWLVASRQRGVSIENIPFNLPTIIIVRSHLTTKSKSATPSFPGIRRPYTIFLLL